MNSYDFSRMTIKSIVVLSFMLANGEQASYSEIQTFLAHNNLPPFPNYDLNYAMKIGIVERIDAGQYKLTAKGSRLVEKFGKVWGRCNPVTNSFDYLRDTEGVPVA